MDTYIVISLISSLIIISYFFNVLSRWVHIPSVLLLLATGVILKQVLSEPLFEAGAMRQLVQFLGVTGLVMIVLEASLDLKLSREKLVVVRNAFLSAAIIFFVASFLVSFVIHLWLDIPWSKCLVYAIPVSIISSAIVIPSAAHLPPNKKEFVVYESSMSDIIGILSFNFLTVNETFGAGTFIGFTVSFILVLFASLAATFVLVWLTGKITTSVRFFLLLAILFLLYATGKLYHLPSLILVMTFGLTLNNIDLITHPWVIGILNSTRRSALFKQFAFWMNSFFQVERLAPIVSQFVSITTETSFLLRTFFFILFGFSISLTALSNYSVLAVGFSIVAVLVVVRVVYFLFFLHENLFPEVFMMPRGLITILLFYSIPERLRLTVFDTGILFVVIVGTTLLMAAGLVYYKKREITRGT